MYHEQRRLLCSASSYLSWGITTHLKTVCLYVGFHFIKPAASISSKWWNLLQEGSVNIAYVFHENTTIRQFWRIIRVCVRVSKSALLEFWTAFVAYSVLTMSFDALERELTSRSLMLPPGTDCKGPRRGQLKTLVSTSRAYKKRLGFQLCRFQRRSPPMNGWKHRHSHTLASR